VTAGGIHSSSPKKKKREGGRVCTDREGGEINRHRKKKNIGLFSRKEEPKNEKKKIARDKDCAEMQTESRGGADDDGSTAHFLMFLTVKKSQERAAV